MQKLFVSVMVCSLAMYTGAYAEAAEKPSLFLAAVYSNDSSSIDINHSSNPSNDDDSSGQSGETPTSPDDPGGIDDFFSSSDSNSGSQNSSSPSSGVTIPVIITTSSESGSESAGISQGDQTGSSQSSQEGGQLPNAEDVVKTLLGNAAVSYTGGATPGAAITLSGAKTRTALKARGISGISLPDIASLLKKKFLTKEDFTLVAVGSILKNKSIEDVILALDSLTLKYRAEGRLFAIIPMPYPITVTVNPNAGTREERITVTFPWYRFFLQTFVSRSELQRDLDAAIDTATLENNDSIDAKTRLFIAVTETIKARFDTVEGSLRN